MPANRLRSSLLKPLVALAVPGMYLVYKYNQFKRQQQENSRRKVTEKELEHLNHKIDKLLAKLDEHEGGDEPKIAEEEECVVCLCAKATMQTFPCGHRVVCRKCFVKTIQVAVSQRCLPLRCVVCRSRILKLRQAAEEPLTPQLPRKQYPGAAAGFYTPTIRPKMPKHSSSLRQFFSSGKQRSSSPGSVAGRRAGQGAVARPAPVATKLMQPLLIYPSQNSPKQHRAFGITDSPRLDMAASGSSSSSASSSRRHRLPMAAAASSSSASASVADAFMLRGPGDSPKSQPGRGSRSQEQSSSGHYNHLMQSPRLAARCSHCSPHIHPSPRPASVSRGVKHRV